MLVECFDAGLYLPDALPLTFAVSAPLSFLPHADVTNFTTPLQSCFLLTSTCEQGSGVLGLASRRGASDLRSVALKQSFQREFPKQRCWFVKAALRGACFQLSCGA